MCPKINIIIWFIILYFKGFLSSCRFLDDGHILTGSGDMKICVWDLEAGKKTHDFLGHAGDVVKSKSAW